MMTADEIYKYVHGCAAMYEQDMDEMGFGPDNMGEWEQGNYEAYAHLLSMMTRN